MTENEGLGDIYLLLYILSPFIFLQISQFHFSLELSNILSYICTKCIHLYIHGHLGWLHLWSYLGYMPKTGSYGHSIFFFEESPSWFL